jgi:serine protease Do
MVACFHDRRRSPMRLGPAVVAALGLAAVIAGMPATGLAQSTPQAAAPVAHQDFAALAARLLPSVVSIQVERALPGMPRDATHQGFAPTSGGSGFFVRADGLVVTNNHVVEGGSAFAVTLDNGRSYQAVLVGRDPETDLAVLRVSVRGLTFPALNWADSDAVAVGQWAIAIGSPFGLGNSFSVGVVSGRNRDIQAGRYDDYIQTDAAINRGNSGGPLFDASGRVIGVNTAIVSPGGQGGSAGVGFAVPANQARRVVSDLIAVGYVRRGWIGLSARPARADEGAGVVVTQIARGAPAATGGLRVGDRITGFAGRPVNDPRTLARLVADAAAGSRVRLDGVRGQGRIFANVTVGRPPSEQRALSARAAPPASALGLTLRGKIASDGMPASVAVVISGVDPLGPGRRILQTGDGLAEVQGRAVSTPGEARARLEEAARQRDAVVVRIWRDGQLVYRALRSPR